MSITELSSERMLMQIQETYDPETVLFESNTSGTYTLDIFGKGVYEIYCIGGGGGGATYGRPAASGGSGSGFIGEIKLPKGALTLTIGGGGNASTKFYAGSGGNSSIGDLVIAYGGGGAFAYTSDARVGVGGSIPIVNTEIIGEPTLHKAGNNGSGGSSLTDRYWNTTSVYNGYGNGGSARSNPSSKNANPGSSGYIKIIYKRLKP